MDEGVGLFVQVTLTQKQAELIHLGLWSASLAAGTGMSDQLGSLAAFFNDVAENPRAFPVRGAMARSIKTRLRMQKRIDKLAR